MGLRAAGWHVTGRDRSPDHEVAALTAGAIDQIGDDADAQLCILAVPVGEVVAQAHVALANSSAVVTDVGSVKSGIVAAVTDPRFVGGHPMAGSEQDGVAGSDPMMFAGSTWVLTPGPTTSPDAYALVQAAVGELGAEVVVLDPDEHDRVVAMVSHVPHLTAVTLMRMASARSAQHASVLRLDAGGFRDMTRIAAGSPAIWPDICVENRDAICDALDELIDELTALRGVVADADRSELLSSLTAARSARLSLPTTVPLPERIVELRVLVPDRPGVLAEVTAAASDAGVNIYDIEIAHSAEGPRGVLILVVGDDESPGLTSRLDALGYRVRVRELT